MKKVLIFGGNGLLGKSFMELFNYSKNYSVKSTSRSPTKDQITCDILDKKSIEKCFRKTTPDIVINCTNLAGGVNFCEKNPDISNKFHFEANKNISSLAKKYNSTFVLISTDYVFDGKKGPYKEDDPKNPLNVYGHHKLAAENWISKNIEHYIIARTTNVFGWDPTTKTPNFVMQLHFNLTKGKTVKVASFLKGNPTYVDDLTKTISKLIELDKSGIYHIVGSSNIDRYSWALKFCELFSFDKSLITEIKEIPNGMTPRPLISNLATDKLNNDIGHYLSPVDKGLQLFFEKSNSNG